MVNNRDDDPVGTRPTLDGGGDAGGGGTPGRAYSSVQCLALLSCCLLFLTYSVAIEGTVDVVMIVASDQLRSTRDALPSGSSDSLSKQTGR